MYVCVTVGELALSNFERKKKHLESPKVFTARWRPLELECPYNSSNETKNTNAWVFTFLYSLHKLCIFLYISTCAAWYNHKLFVLYKCIVTQCFILWMNQFLNESSEPVIQWSMFRLYIGFMDNWRSFLGQTWPVEKRWSSSLLGWCRYSV